MIKDALLLGDIFEAPTVLFNLTKNVHWHTVNLIEFLAILCFPVFLSNSFTSTSLINSLRHAIYFIFPIALVILTLQLSTNYPLFLLNRGEFWQIVGRFSASFSDPNSLGICSALFIVFLMSFSKSETRILDIIISIGYFLIAMKSGSRSFFLILLLNLLYVTFDNRDWLLKRKKIIFSVSFASLVLIFLFKNNLPISLERLITSITPGKVSENLESRFIYAKIGWATILQHPLLGVGLGRFFFTQLVTAKSIGINLGPWRDNANNFYAQLATEGGILALVLILFGLYLLLSSQKINNDAKIVSRIIIVFLISMLFGPHINFIEIKFIFSILLGIFLSGSSFECSQKLCFAVYTIALSYIFAQLLTPRFDYAFINQGLYPKEESQDPDPKCKFIRWTGSHGRILTQDMALSDINKYSILIKNINPSKELQFKYSHRGEVNLKLSPNSKTEVFLDRDVRYLDFNIYNTWSPNLVLGIADHRQLGVQICYKQ